MSQRRFPCATAWSGQASTGAAAWAMNLNENFGRRFVAKGVQLAVAAPCLMLSGMVEDGLGCEGIVGWDVGGGDIGLALDWAICVFVSQILYMTFCIQHCTIGRLVWAGFERQCIIRV